MDIKMCDWNCLHGLPHLRIVKQKRDCHLTPPASRLTATVGPKTQRHVYSAEVKDDDAAVFSLDSGGRLSEQKPSISFLVLSVSRLCVFFIIVCFSNRFSHHVH